jgi:DNA polymerase type B, organellar and viral
MKSMSMPVGNITFFDGDITKINKNAFGFFNVEIIAPDNLNHPILQTRVDTGNGLRTVAPLGKWKDMIFSEEMNNAIKYGYKFNILSGYLFEQANIFSEYIEDLYEIKKYHNKDEPMYLISKLLMNSLYGRFGMDYMLYTHNIIEDNELYNLIDNYSINEIIPLDDNKSLVSYLDDNNIKNVLLSNESKSNISISIAAAITAGARIHMSQFKNNPNYNLYYSDTDSIDIDKPLPDYYVGKELGDMKLYSNIIFILNVKNSYI